MSHVSCLKIGFTFIELIFVMLVLGLLMVSALPRFQHAWSRLQTEAAAFEVAQTLRVARTLAVTQGQPVDWTWDADGRRVVLEGHQPDGSSAPILERFGRSRAVPEQVQLTVVREQEDGEPIERIRFFPDGTSQPTTLLIGDARARFQIGVDETTGQVAVQRAPY